MNHHLMYPKQRDFNRDLDDVLSFCKEHGFYFQNFGQDVDPVNETNKYANYRIIRVLTDGDQHTYCFMEAFVDEDDCDCYREIFSIQLDFYDTQTVLLNELEIGCGGCDSRAIHRPQVRPTSPKGLPPASKASLSNPV